MHDCIFCDIATSKKAHVISENKHALAFLDIDPITPGHVLIISKAHVLDLDELNNVELLSIMAMARKVIKAFKISFDPKGYSIMQNGGAFNDIGHFHIHIFPRQSEEEFGWTYGKVEEHNISEMVATLKETLEKL